MTEITKVVIFGGVVQKSERSELVGTTRFYVDAHDSEGGILGVWDGETAEAARAAAREWDVPVIDTTAH